LQEVVWFGAEGSLHPSTTLACVNAIYLLATLHTRSNNLTQAFELYSNLTVLHSLTGDAANLVRTVKALGEPQGSNHELCHHTDGATQH
jgi:hypothetical protein